MSIYTLLLILIASLTHAYWNYLSKQANGKIPFIWLIYIASSVIYVPFLLWQVHKGNISFSWLVINIALLSAVLRLAYFIVLQTGYRKGDLSVVYPLARGSGPFFSAIGAVFLMHEQPTVFSVLGLLFIITGVLIITKIKLATGLSTKLKTGLSYGLVTGLFIGCYTLWDKVAVSHYALSPLVITYISNLLGAIVLAPIALKRIAETRKEIKLHTWHILAIAVLSPFSYMLVLVAMKTTPVLYVAPARELSILFGVFMGGRLMNEEDTKRRVAGSLFILTGIILLAVG
jgi:drug/metabolite transporter (DMT)-like permease